MGEYKHECKKIGSDCYGLREMTLLFEVSQRLISSKELTTDINPVLRLMVEYLHAERSFLTIFNRKTSQIAIEAAYGMSASQQSRGRYQLGEGVIGRVIELGQPVVIAEISKSNLFINKTKSELTKNGNELTFICVPIMDSTRATGALSITREFNANISYEEDIRLMTIIGSLIAKVSRAHQETIEELDSLKQKNQELKSHLNNDLRPSNIIGSSSKMRDIFSLIERVAKTNSTVLIRGESGIGKELIADAIHYSSSRSNKNLVKVNCSALPESLIESELFGYEKGAFTGADQRRIGRFESANGGTIFLDEIGDLPLQTQVKLLRVLQERQFERLGGSETISIDVRVITATNRDLEKLIDSGQIREDFFYRINVFPLFIPPLRDRRDDIPVLANHFIDKFNKRNGTSIVRITTSAINMLMVYQWPGNVRELENCIERGCIMSKDNVVHSYDLPPTLQTAESSNTQAKGGMMDYVERLEKQLIREALTTTNGNMSKAAELLNITERMLGTRVSKYNIDIWRFKL